MLSILGPANLYETIPPRSAQSHRGANGVARNVSSGSVPRTGSSTSLPRRAESSAGRSRLQILLPLRTASHRAEGLEPVMHFERAIGPTARPSQSA